MNTKIRALLWEELRVGGAIATVATLAGLVAQLSIRLGTMGENAPHRWHDLSDQVLVFTLGPPLFAALALVLNTANSGHLTGGFSRRILRLPVDTWSAVLVMLLTRLIEVLVMSTAMIASCQVLFQNGPGARAVFFLAWIYLLIQLLDWARYVTVLVVPAVIVAVLWALLTTVGGFRAWSGAMLSQQGVTPTLLLIFALSAVVAYGVSVAVVRWTRSCVHLSLLTTWVVEASSPFSSMASRKPFRSPLAAQVWFESRRAGVSFPTMVMVSYLLCITGWIAGRNLMASPGETFGEGSIPEGQWLYEVIPFAAVLLASFAWRLQTGWGDMRRQGALASFALRQPVTTAQKAQARLFVAGTNLAATLAVVTFVFILHALLGDDLLLSRLVSEALVQRETNLRELLGFFVGLPLVAGLVAWVIMESFLGVGKWMAVALCGVVSVLLLIPMLSLFGLQALLPDGIPVTFRPAIWVLILLPTLGLVFGLTISLQRGLMSRRYVLACVLLWVVIAAGIFPYSLFFPGSSTYVILLASIGWAALPLLPYPASLLGQSRRARKERLIRENPEQHLRQRRGGRAARAANAVVILIALAGFVWIRWPAEPAYKAAWREQSLPTNLAELNEWYTPVEKSRNLAERYLDIAQKAEKLDADREARRDGEMHFSEEVLGVGYPELKLTEQIDPGLWRQTKRYWDAVGRKVCPDLHAAAHAGLTESRYPVDFRVGLASLDLPHLSNLRTLSGFLSLEVWVAVVDRHPETAEAAILDTFPLEESLRNEPLMISQFARQVIQDMACKSLQNAMSRIAFSEGSLERIQEKLDLVLPPLEQDDALIRALVGEQLETEDALAHFGFPKPHPKNIVEESGKTELLALEALAPAMELSGFLEVNRIVRVRYYSQARECLREYLLTGGSSRAISSSQRSLQRLPFWLLFAPRFLPGLQGDALTPLRTRTEFDLARVAVAVERFRLSQGQLPHQLDELVPGFLDKVPRDPWHVGYPVSYVIKDNGEYTVYSFALNRKDDHGEGSSEGRSWFEGDIAFTVAPPEFRDRPQVASETSVSEK